MKTYVALFVVLIFLLSGCSSSSGGGAGPTTKASSPRTAPVTEQATASAKRSGSLNTRTDTVASVCQSIMNAYISAASAAGHTYYDVTTKAYDHDVAGISTTNGVAIDSLTCAHALATTRGAAPDSGQQVSVVVSDLNPSGGQDSDLYQCPVIDYTALPNSEELAATTGAGSVVGCTPPSVDPQYCFTGVRPADTHNYWRAEIDATDDVDVVSGVDCQQLLIKWLPTWAFNGKASSLPKG